MMTNQSLHHSGDIYEAPDHRKPESSSQLAFRLASRLYFPPLLLWDALGVFLRLVARRLLSLAIVPAQRKKFDRHEKWPGNLAAQIAEKSTDDLPLSRLTVVTHDKARLDTVEIMPAGLKAVPIASQRAVIEFTGNTDCCELNVDEMIADARELGCRVVGFNLRGVRESSPAPKNTMALVTDGIAQVQRLLDQGILPENIVLKGHSLGGGIATLVAKHFHDIGQKICLFNDRSFSSITEVVACRFLSLGSSWRTGHHETLAGRIVTALFRPVIRLVLHLTGWEMNAGPAYMALPETHKDYTVIRSREEKRREYFMDDTVIPHKASLHLYPLLKEIRKAAKMRIETTMAALQAVTWLTEQRRKIKIESLEQKLRHLKEHKIPGIPHDPDNRCNHVKRLSGLVIRSYSEPEETYSAQAYFWNFFRRATLGSPREEFARGCTEEKRGPSPVSS